MPTTRLLPVAVLALVCAAAPASAQAGPLPQPTPALAGAQGPVVLSVPAAAERAASMVAARCSGFHAEAAGYHERAALLAQRESLCRECDYSAAIQRALGQASVAEQRFVGCVRDIERVVAEAVAQARTEALRLSGYDGVPWGTALEAVRARRGEPAVERSGTLCYPAAPMGLDAYACFTFAEGGLAHGRTVFLREHANPQNYVAVFEAVADTIAVSYGPPTSDEEQWTAEPAPGETLAQGLRAGRAVRTARWERPGGTMTMQLRGRDGSVTHVVEYVPDED